MAGWMERRSQRAVLACRQRHNLDLGEWITEKWMNLGKNCGASMGVRENLAIKMVHCFVRFYV